MKDVFVATKNCQLAEEACEECLNSAHGIEMVAIVGRAGRGKTTAAQRIATMTPQALFVRFEEWMTPIGLLREMAFHVAGERPHTTLRCRALLATELSRLRRMFLVDEADRMSRRHLNVLRDLHDVFSVPVVLIGEEALIGRLSQERRLTSRVRSVIHFKPVDAGDVNVFFRMALGQQLTIEQATRLAQHSQGDFRFVVRDAADAERMMEASGLDRITDRLIEVICGNGQPGG